MSDTDLLLTYYGDDFTGSTDVLESLSLNGVETVLFLEPPGPEDLDDMEGVQAVGLAGTSRSMTPSEMDGELRPKFEALAAFEATICHYKVCSTFDSSPTRGSIGHAIDLGLEVFDSPFVPVVVSAPSLQPRGRYVLFGNLFATVDGETYRLDRHPTMSEHPVTPMTEADLRRHLGEQTDRNIRLLDIRSIDQPDGESLETDLEKLLTAEPEVVVFDGLNHDHQRRVGRLIWERATQADGTMFSASSSGLEYALANHWQETGVVEKPAQVEPVESVDQLLVMSGSASPVNADQMTWAFEHGFEGVRLDTEELVDPEGASAERTRAVEAALELLDADKSPLLYTARGPDDSAIERTSARLDELGIDRSEIGRRLGNQQGQITRKIVETAGLDRLCVAGGDTSGFVAPHLDVYALEFVVPVGPGSPLCRARSRTASLDGLEVALKGGQVQTTNDESDYFGLVRAGGDPTS